MIVLKIFGNSLIHKPDGAPNEEGQVDQEGDGEDHLVLPGEYRVEDADEQVDGAREDGEHGDEGDEGVVDPGEEEADTGEGEKNKLHLGVVRDTQESAHHLQQHGHSSIRIFHNSLKIF